MESEPKQTSVRKLISGIEAVLDRYAEELQKKAKGLPVDTPIDDKTIDTMIKMVKEMTNFEQFERIANPQQAGGKEIKRNPLEERTKSYKANGGTANS